MAHSLGEAVHDRAPGDRERDRNRKCEQSALCMPDARLGAMPDVVFSAPCTVQASCGGLGVFARERIPAGTILLSERPFALTPSFAERSRVCAVCFQQATPPEEWTIHCGMCGCVSYCTDACRQFASTAELHSQAECSAFRAWSQGEGFDATDPLNDLVIQAIRILAHRLAGVRIRALDSTDVDAVAYHSYAHRLLAMRRNARTSNGIKKAVQATLHAFPEARVEAKELAGLLSRHQCNVFGVLGERGSSVGLASFLGAMHLFNHSCMPNAAFDSVPAITQGRGEPATFRLVSILDISPGEEICHCYAASADGPSKRLQYLRDNHGFECVCVRCACDDPSEEAELAEQLDEVRCCLPSCGSGLSFPVAGQGRSDVVVRQCVHCGGRWECDEGV